MHCTTLHNLTMHHGSVRTCHRLCTRCVLAGHFVIMARGTDRHYLITTCVTDIAVTPTQHACIPRAEYDTPPLRVTPTCSCCLPTALVHDCTTRHQNLPTRLSDVSDTRVGLTRVSGPLTRHIM